jgi:hypothetical protein
VFTFKTKSYDIKLLKAVTVFIDLNDINLYKEVAFSFKWLNGFQSRTQFYAQLKRPIKENLSNYKILCCVDDSVEY